MTQVGDKGRIRRLSLPRLDLLYVGARLPWPAAPLRRFRWNRTPRTQLRVALRDGEEPAHFTDGVFHDSAAERDFEARLEVWRTSPVDERGLDLIDMV